MLQCSKPVLYLASSARAPAQPEHGLHGDLIDFTPLKSPRMHVFPCCYSKITFAIKGPGGAAASSLCPGVTYDVLVGPLQQIAKSRPYPTASFHAAFPNCTWRAAAGMPRSSSHALLLHLAAGMHRRLSCNGCLCLSGQPSVINLNLRLRTPDAAPVGTLPSFGTVLVANVVGPACLNPCFSFRRSHSPGTDLPTSLHPLAQSTHKTLTGES